MIRLSLTFKCIIMQTYEQSSRHERPAMCFLISQQYTVGNQIKRNVDDFN